MTRRKPRIGLDTDGVLADILTPCFRIASEMLGRDLTVDHMTGWDLDHLLPPELVKPFWDKVGEPGLCRNLVPYPGAVEGVAALREVADVYIVTSYLSNGKQWVHERDAWFEENFKIPDSKMVHTKAKYTFFGKSLVDDKPQNVQEWGDEHTGGLPVLWLQPYNEKFVFSGPLESRVRRTNSWADVVAYAEALAARAV